MAGDGSSVTSSMPDALYTALYPPMKKLKKEVSTKVLPCVLCASPERDGLLPVNDKPFIIMGVATPVGENGEEEWMAHEYCAMVVPETWVDEVNGQKRVFGVDAIAKDRWGLVSITITTDVTSSYLFSSVAERAQIPNSKLMVLLSNAPRANAPRLSMSIVRRRANQGLVLKCWRSRN